MLLGMKSYIKWQGGSTLALRPAATLPMTSVPSSQVVLLPVNGGTYFFNWIS